MCYGIETCEPGTFCCSEIFYAVICSSSKWALDRENTNPKPFQYSDKVISWQLSSLWLGHIWPWRPQLLNINHFPWGSTQCKACIKLMVNSDWKDPGYACVNCSWGTVYYEVNLFGMEIPWLLVWVAVYNRLASVDIIWNNLQLLPELVHSSLSPSPWGSWVRGQCCRLASSGCLNS